MEVLDDMYRDPAHPGSLGGVEALYRAAKGKVSRKKIQEWLKGQPAYTLHKPIRHRFHRNRVVVLGIDDQWQADLVDLSSLKKYNEPNRYLLTCIDIFFQICLGDSYER